MAEPVQERRVPLFHPLGAEQRNSADIERNAVRNSGGTANLKALAHKVLERNAVRNSGGAKGGNSCSAPPQKIEESGTPVPVPVPPEDEHDERAAIIEYEAGAPREWAEGAAKLMTMPVPIGYPPKRWHELQNAAGVFIDKFATQAAALGWSALDIFGCDPVSPFERLDRAGLLLLLHVDEAIVAVTGCSVTTRSRTGSVLRYYRAQRQTGAALIWSIDRPSAGNGQTT